MLALLIILLMMIMFGCGFVVGQCAASEIFFENFEKALRKERRRHKCNMK